MYIICTLDLELHSHSHRWQDHNQGRRLDYLTILTLPHCTSLHAHYRTPQQWEVRNQWKGEGCNATL